MMEAQRFPADYDGIIAGAPEYSLTHVLLASFTTDIQAKEADSFSYIPSGKLPAIGKSFIVNVLAPIVPEQAVAAILL